METRYIDAVLVLKALAHPGRLALVEALASGEKCVCALHEIIDCDFSTVSKHLALMKRAGIVEARREGLKIFYRLRVPCLLRFLDCVAALTAQSSQTAGTSTCCTLFSAISVKDDFI